MHPNRLAFSLLPFPNLSSHPEELLRLFRPAERRPRCMYVNIFAFVDVPFVPAIFFSLVLLAVKEIRP